MDPKAQKFDWAKFLCPTLITGAWYFFKKKQAKLTTSDLVEMLQRGGGSHQKKTYKKLNWIPETTSEGLFTFPKHCMKYACMKFQEAHETLYDVVDSGKPAECRNNYHRIQPMSLWHVPAASLLHLPMSHH